MEKIRNWIGTWHAQIKMTLTIIIGIAVLIFGGWNIVHAVKEFGARKMKEGLKSLGYAALIIFIGIVSYSGMVQLVNLIKPDTGVIPQGGTVAQ